MKGTFIMTGMDGLDERVGWSGRKLPTTGMT